MNTDYFLGKGNSKPALKRDLIKLLDKAEKIQVVMGFISPTGFFSLFFNNKPSKKSLVSKSDKIH